MPPPHREVSLMCERRCLMMLLCPLVFSGDPQTWFLLKTVVGGGWSAVLVLEAVSLLWRSEKKRGGGFTDDVHVFVVILISNSELCGF
ncbi:hypothetical protein HanRHA438_Chr08g0371551 [Helianthus annuus]|uniref:Uncharacterized protein n=1 Tax=Helianthus annuus TaxID=4232 RepID=A0A9K3IHG5_HELAN|nr:hypothetical protein HanXRQr2_Chr08g0359451 [Helianthus annuus]KAJ0540317.1 hypothetical protein HanHA300_Chr08g0296881 [Helianthus annuus]KAJ0555060.1 hypothetical protein HanHA89_Chr08g0315381 [Helianthus annuus]KAJ0720627.1 hypothetical protein HanLR1_Chr08g0295731 [Helianthus annuus]KAJ0899697.1 hypothetical protein HanRHA438_Chr08g0371551 [Helianthus annuus]